ncbi:hypothetical protein BO85DRAFT_520273 [Aspergillus piperis CBS 112811]|uniref:Glycoside hydrolase n=1 Tax=Aspergillus piperis CBS 112811 TaxID=1448313 RepID=A0A8G1R4E8_9EURO|nr:hypothetical protein BO85DRAFT_520273 [Aspergillus piperis CBS 112811]RAH57540.1 hypothetical protein BO85DRAFT_520273 [Aspergillus piperis CBS 112811]
MVCSTFDSIAGVQFLYPSCYNTSYTVPESEGGWLIGPASDPGSIWFHKAIDWLARFLHYIQDTWNRVNGITIAEFEFSGPFEAKGLNLWGARLGVWLADYVEWRAGYPSRFGVQYVNLTTQERFYKASFFELANLFRTYIQG